MSSDYCIVKIQNLWKGAIFKIYLNEANSKQLFKETQVFVLQTHSSKAGNSVVQTSTTTPNSANPCRRPTTAGVWNVPFELDKSLQPFQNSANKNCQMQ